MALRRWKTIFGRLPVHEATRRAWCRLLFVFAGALPVFLTFIACCAERVPAYQRARVAHYSRLLSQVTGISVQVERVELLEPTKRMLRGVRLSHPETGLPLGRIEGLWISETPTGCAIHAQQTQISTEQLSDCYRLLHEQVLCRPSSQPHAMVLFMNDLTIKDQSEASIAFSKVQFELKRQPLATAASLRFRLENFNGHEALMSFSRHHDQVEPISHWTLNTGDQAIPGDWVNRFASNYSLPGAQAVLTGSFDLKYNQAFWNLSGAGRLHRVDAASWFERPLLSGLAFADITGFSLTNRGLNAASGSLLIQEGRIHSDLLVAAKDIGISAVAGHEAIEQRSGNVLPFQAIAADFKLDGEGLRIDPRRADGVVVYDAVGPMAKFGKYSLIPNNNLAVCICNTAPNDTQRSSTFSRVIQWLPRPSDVVPANHQVSQ